MDSYDYIIAGSGAAGLSMAYHMANDPFFDQKKILIIDKEPKNAYDRTWCFWSDSDDLFPEVIYKKWNKIEVKTPSKKSVFPIHPYTYNLIRSHDFYQYIYSIIENKKNFTIKYEFIEEIRKHGTIVTSKSLYRGNYIFSSISHPIRHKKGNITLLQHFKGWYVRTKTPVFQTDVATLMDFDIEQYNECRFCYILPISAEEAMVEYTVFSESVLEDTVYDQLLGKYINNRFGNIEYAVTHTEFGVIPMSDFLYLSDLKSSVINIGTSGGATKGSTGYTFYFIQKQTKFYIEQIKKGRIQKLYIPPYKYRLYDSVLLRVLLDKKIPAYTIFEDLFFKLKIQEVFDFLNEKSTLFQDLKIMSSVNIPVFLSTMLQQIQKVK